MTEGGERARERERERRWEEEGVYIIVQTVDY